MQNNKNLKIIILRRNRLDEAGTKEFTDCIKSSELEEIDLGSNFANDNGISYFSKFFATNHHITKLVLSDNRLGNDAIEFLSQAIKTQKSLTFLDLSDNQIGCNGMKFFSEALKDHNCLTDLNLAFNRIKKDGAFNLCSALTKNRSLKRLNLRCNQIEKGADYFAQMLRNNHFLKFLDIAHNTIDRIDKHAFVSIFQANRSITQLNMELNHFHDKTFFETINSFLDKNKNIPKLIKQTLLILRNRRDNLFSMIPRRLLFYLFQFFDY